MTSKTYYVKNGRKYVPVAEYDSEFYDSFPYGASLVIIEQGYSHRIFKIDPADAPMIAAGYHARQSMIDAIYNASQARPAASDIITEDQHKAWEQCKEAFGTEFFYLQYPSIHEIVDAGLTAMSEEAEKMLEHPAVKDAYESFMTVWKLVKDQQKETG